jgi:hypothetical protein
MGDATELIGLSPNSAQKSDFFTHASLIWILKFTILVPRALIFSLNQVFPPNDYFSSFEASNFSDNNP